MKKIYCGKCWAEMVNEGEVTVIGESYIVNGNRSITANVYRCPYCDETVITTQNDGNEPEPEDYDIAFAVVPLEVNRPIKTEIEEKAKGECLDLPF